VPSYSTCLFYTSLALAKFVHMLAHFGPKPRLTNFKKCAHLCIVSECRCVTWEPLLPSFVSLCVCANSLSAHSPHFWREIQNTHMIAIFTRLEPICWRPCVSLPTGIPKHNGSSSDKASSGQSDELADSGMVAGIVIAVVTLVLIVAALVSPLFFRNPTRSVWVSFWSNCALHSIYYFCRSLKMTIKKII